MAMKKCKECGEEISSSAKKCPKCGKDQRNFFMKHPILYTLIIIIVIAMVTNSGSDTTNTSTTEKYTVDTSVEVTVVDFSLMDSQQVAQWCDSNKINYEISKEYSDTIESGKLISQSESKDAKIHPGDKIKIVYSLGKEPSTEFKNALRKAETYSETMHMSKQGIYDQLTSEYGEQFPADAAQYAIDNMDADWNKNALKKAETYSETMHMSKEGIYDQLISEYGEKFTKEEAQYAVDNIVADWNANALEKAKSYQTTMSMSKSAIYDQLISEYGEKFTKEEAQYAIDNLE